MAWIGMMLSGGGLYVIYQNKVEMGKDHFTTLHSWGECGIDWWCFVVIVEQGKLFRCYNGLHLLASTFIL